MASLQISGKHYAEVLNALAQAEAAVAECAGNEKADITIDLSGTVLTITNNRESRTGYQKVWVF